MIDLSLTNEWQHRDPETGLVFPWYVKSFLDELVTWELKDKVVFEYGAGASTVWWASHCKKLYAVESSKKYFDAVASRVGHWARIAHETELERYVKSSYQWCKEFDIIIIDGEPIEWRDACVQPALDCLKPGGKLIFDNWLQPSVGWLPSEETQRLVTSLPHIVYSQAGHPDWKTLVVTKP
jgi:predicted O-methyltransferase YrrM